MLGVFLSINHLLNLVNMRTSSETPTNSGITLCMRGAYLSVPVSTTYILSLFKHGMMRRFRDLLASS